MLPNRWNGSPAASALEIYIHCATSVPYLAALNTSIEGVARYAERALLLAKLEDVVCVPDAVDQDYLEYLHELGLGPRAENIVVLSQFERAEPWRPLWQRLLASAATLDHIAGLLRGRSSGRIHPFIASRGQFQLAAALEQRTGIPVRVAGGPARVVAYADCKHHIRDKAIQLGIPVAPGEVVDLRTIPRGSRGEIEPLLKAMERQIEATGRVIVRGTWGAAGSATYVAACEDVLELARHLASSGANRVYLVESMVKATASPNVQMEINPDTGAIECTGVTDQRWELGLVHGGNVYPSGAHCTGAMIRWAHALTAWLRDEGVRGVVGLDFVEHSGPGGVPEAFLAELNPRVNGATYPLHLARRLGLGAFVSGMARTEASAFWQVRELLNDLLFSPGRRNGVLPYVSGGLQYGKCGIIALAGTAPEAAEWFREAQSALKRQCVMR